MSLIPNSFQYPNYYNDVLDQYLTPEESKVLTRAIREIFGWENTRVTREKQISISTFEYGNKRIGSAGIGMNRQTIINALENLHKYKILLKVGNRNDPNGQIYRLNLDETTINVDGLRQRLLKKQLANKHRTEKATKASLTKRSAGTSDVMSAGTSDVMSTGTSDVHTERKQKDKQKETTTTTETATAETTTENDVDVAVVVEKINSIIRKKKKGAFVNAAYIENLCKLHQTTYEQILLCAQALAEIPSIKSIAGMMMGTKDSDGRYQSSCFLGGICILTPPAEPEPERAQYIPIEIDYEAEIKKIDDETKKSIMQRVEADMSSYKSRMSQQDYESTLQVGYENALAKYVYQLKYEFV